MRGRRTMAMKSLVLSSWRIPVPPERFVPAIAPAFFFVGGRRGQSPIWPRWRLLLGCSKPAFCLPTIAVRHRIDCYRDAVFKLSVIVVERGRDLRELHVAMAVDLNPLRELHELAVARSILEDW